MMAVTKSFLKKIMKRTQLILAIILMAGLWQKSNAQDLALPNPSTKQTIIQELGLGKVSITYSRPHVKNRKIFGGLVPFGQVWRTGANEATAITFSENVIVEGHHIPAGTYALFCIPEKELWTIILNRAVGQWGSYTYNQQDDLVRFTIKPEQVTEQQESFTIQFINPTTNSTAMALSWDHTHAAIHIAANDDAKIMANIDQLMSAEKITNLTYFNAIQYYYINNKDNDQALKWISGAEKAFPKRGSYRLFESRFLLRKGDKAGARSAAEEGIRLSKEKHDEEYLRLNEEALELAKK